MLAVATFSHPDHFGGAERVVADVTAGLAARGHEVTLVTSRVGAAPAEEHRDGVRRLRYAVDRRSPARFYRSVVAGVRGTLATLEPRAFDVVHLHQMLSAVAALAPGSATRRLPALFSFYAPYHLEYLARFRDGGGDGAVPARARAVAAMLRLGDRYALGRADRVLVLSEFCRGQVAELAPAVAPGASVAPAGVDLSRFRPAADEAERHAAARRLGLPADAPLVVTVRRLVERMGLPDLVEAARRLSARGVAAHVAIAGEGPLRARLQAAAEGELAGRLTLAGRVPEDDLPALYRAASVFVLPTRSLEGFGMATVEALASGLPVVVTDAGASREVVAGARGARIVPPRDPGRLAEALAALLADPSARARAGRAARAHAERAHAWDGHLDAIEHAAGRAREARR